MEQPPPWSGNCQWNGDFLDSMIGEAWKHGINTGVRHASRVHESAARVPHGGAWRACVAGLRVGIHVEQYHVQRLHPVGLRLLGRIAGI